jgi:hypothetical protein
MKPLILAILFALMSTLAIGATSSEKIQYQNAFENLNREIQHELLYGDLTQRSVRKNLRSKIKTIKPLARKVGGRRHSLMVVMSFNQTLNSLVRMNKKYREALDMTYENGLTGREIIVKATDPENNRRILEIYEAKKATLTAFSNHDLRSFALDLTLQEIENIPDFDFLKITPQRNYVMQDKTFTFFADKCIPARGEEDLFVLLFGYNQCTTPKYKINRFTVGLGYYNANSGFAYVTGLKIGKKNFHGVGAKVQFGIFYGGGIGVFLGNGLILSLDLEKGYGVYAGATYMNVKHK